MEEHEELVLSSLSMLNNLTFYANEESVVFERQTEVTHCKYPFKMYHPLKWIISVMFGSTKTQVANFG